MYTHFEFVWTMTTEHIENDPFTSTATARMNHTKTWHMRITHWVIGNEMEMLPCIQVSHAQQLVHKISNIICIYLIGFWNPPIFESKRWRSHGFSSVTPHIYINQLNNETLTRLNIQSALNMCLLYTQSATVHLNTHSHARSLSCCCCFAALFPNSTHFIFMSII